VLYKKIILNKNLAGPTEGRNKAAGQNIPSAQGTHAFADLQYYFRQYLSCDEYFSNDSLHK
jgi:hypothetical protein